MDDSRLSVAISAHPKRAKMVTDLVQRLEMANQRRQIEVCWDEYGDGVWANARRAWESTRDKRATHHMVIQDDALPCRDLIECVEYINRQLPYDTGALSLFSGHRSIRDAYEAGRAYVWARTAISAVALVQPIWQIRRWLTWCDQNVTPELINDDYRLSMYLLATRKKVAYTAPCLVEHQCNTSSLAEKVWPGQIDHLRVASKFIGEDIYATYAVDWDDWKGSQAASMGNPSSYRRFYVGPGTWEEVLEHGVIA